MIYFYIYFLYIIEAQLKDSNPLITLNNHARNTIVVVAQENCFSRALGYPANRIQLHFLENAV